MTHRRSIATLFGPVMLICVLAAMPVTAQEKSPPTAVLAVAVIDVQRIIRESLATKSMRPQLRKLQDAYEKEFKRQEQELRKANRDLIGQRVILSPEAYTERRGELQKRASAVQRSVQEKKRIIDQAIARTMGMVNRELHRITIEIANERSISLVFVKSAVFLNAKRHNITAEALQRLNKRLPSVDVIAMPKKK
ncbi:MAG: OmpH family outer membrane protein [Acidiferrobacterales bacterium]